VLLLDKTTLVDELLTGWDVLTSEELELILGAIFPMEISLF
jgi:hypothetical protein